MPTATALRTADFSGPELTSADEEDDDEADEVDRYELPSWLEDEDVEAWPYDDELALGEDDFTINTFDTYDTYDTIDPFDDGFDFDGDYDTLPAAQLVQPTTDATTDHIATYDPSHEPDDATTHDQRLRQRRPRLQRADNADDSYNVQSTSSSSSSSVHRPRSRIRCSRVSASDVGVTCGAVQVFALQQALLASVPNVGLFVKQNAGATWDPLPAAGTAAPRVVVRNPSNAAQYWFAGNDGVFKTTDNGATFAELGSLTDVQSLSVTVSATAPERMLAIAGTPAAIHESVDAGATWSNVSSQLPPGVGELGQVAVLEDGSAVLGTNVGIYRRASGTQAFAPASTFSNGVVGPPARGVDGKLYWLLAAGHGLRTSTDNGVTWSPVASTNVINPTASRLQVRADGQLETIGVNDDLIVSSDGGTTWTPAGSKCPLTLPG